MSRYENRKTISLTRFGYVSLRCKDISEVEGKSESAIIEEVLMGLRPPLLPQPKQARNIILRYYLEEDACSKILKAFFDYQTGRRDLDMVDVEEDNERVMVELLHAHLCASNKSFRETDGVKNEQIGNFLNLLKECTNYACSRSDELQKLLQQQIEQIQSNCEYIRHREISQIFLFFWEFVKNKPFTYNVLSLLTELNPIEENPENRYAIIEAIYKAIKNWE